MSHAKGQVKFCGNIKHFEFNGTEGICYPKLYDTYDELLDNWRRPDISIGVNSTTCDKKPWFKNIFRINKGKNTGCHICNHNEEPVEIYTDYGGGFYWKGTACRKCNLLLKGIKPFELPIEDRYINGTPDWVENYDTYYDD